MVTNWYWRRIRKNLNTVVCACGAIPSENRADIYGYLQWKIFEPIDWVLPGLGNAQEYDSREWKVDWKEHKVFSTFERHILDEERRFKTALHRCRYKIDRNSLADLMKTRRPEKVFLSPLSFITVYYTDSLCKYAFPLLCLLLERVAWTMDIKKNPRPSLNELSLLGGSMQTVLYDMRDSAKWLQG